MSALIVHWYQHAETYAVTLAIITVPSGFTALYFFLTHHFQILRLEKENPQAPENKPNA